MVKRSSRRTKGSTGVFLTEDRLVLTTFARGTVGARELDHRELPLGPDGAAGALRELASEGALASEVVCGLDPRRLFSITRRLGLEEAERPPSELLSQQLSSFAGGVVAAMQPVKLPSGEHHHLVAVPRRTAHALHEVLAERGRGGQRFVPVPVALMHLARRSRRQSRREATVLRILPGAEHGLVILCHADRPLAWRLYDVHDAEESLLIAVLGLRSHAQDELGLPRLHALILHGGPAREPLADELAAQFDLPCRAASEVLVDPPTMSRALAHSGLRPQLEDLDLFSDLRPQGGFLHNFPSRVVPALALLIGGLSTHLWMEAVGLESETAQVKSRIRNAAAGAGVDADDLKVLHEKLTREMHVADAFVVQRVFWEEYLNALPQLVPATLRVNRFDGRDAIVFKKKASSVMAKMKQLALSCDVELRLGERQPEEAARLTAALQSSPLVQRDFPHVTGTNIRLESGNGGSLAKISVLCMGGKGGG